VWSHCLCLCCSGWVLFGWLPWRGGPCLLMLCPTLRRCWNQSCVRHLCCVPQPQISPVDRVVCVSCSLHLASMDLPVWPMYTFPHSQGIRYTPGILRPKSSLVFLYWHVNRLDIIFC
jgi:hypothetical protein